MQKFLRTLTLVALLVVPWVTQGQNAKVSEYDYSVTTATYSTIAGTTGATAWTAADQTAGYVDIAMPFAMYFGENEVPANSTLRVYGNGSATFESVTGLSGSRIAPLYYAAGYTTTATSVYTKSSASMLTVEWRKVVSGNNSYSFQLKLYNTGDIEFCYGPMTLNGSISVFTGLMTSSTDVFRARGEGGTLYWNTLERATDYATRTLSATYSPAYNLATNEGVLYTFTQPACVKPTAITAEATAWNKVNVGWTVANNGSKYEIAYSTDADFDADAATGVTRVTVTSGTASSYVVTVPNALTTYYFAVRKYCNNTPSGWLYGASATTPSGCPALSAINSTNVTASAATLYWTTSVAASSFNVRYNLGDDFNPDNNEGTLVTTTDTSKTLTGLTGASTYYYYVRANCVSGLTTDWYGPYTFNTLCGAITVNANNFYTQNFEGYIMPSCWSEEVVAGSDNWGFSGNGQASFTYTPDASSRLITPIFNLNPTGAYQVEFYHAEPDWSGTCDSLWLCYRTSATGEWVRLAQYGNHSSSFEHAVVLLPNPSATYQLAFVSYGMDGNSINLANVVVRTQPTCPNPTTLAVDSQTNSSVTLSWTETGSATAWQIAYGQFTTDDDYVIVSANTNPFTVTGLTAEQTYYFFVRSYCASNDQSEWVGSVSATPTNAAILTVNDGTNTNEYVPVYGYWADNNSRSQLVIPASELTALQWGHINKLTFYSSSASVSWGAAQFNVYMAPANSTTISSLVNWNDLELVYSGSLSISDNKMEIMLDNPYQYIGGDLLIGINQTVSGSYVRAYFYGVTANGASMGGYGTSISQRNFLPKTTFNYIAGEPETCFKPTGLAVSDVTTTTATLTWNELGASTQWEVKYGPVGFNIAEGEGISMIVNTTPSLVLNYLEMGASYDAYVRAICNPEGPTDWNGPVSFTTQYISCLAYGEPGQEEEQVIGTGTATNNYLPCYNYYNYSLTEQIYTPAEVGGSGIINSIAFYNNGSQKTRNIDVYLLETDKASFSGATDWVAVTEAQKVYTGSTTFAVGEWTVLTLSTPFNYSGSGNLLVVVDDNTGSYASSPHAAFLVSDATAQALRIYSDGTNYDPINNPSYSGTVMNVKNNIQLGIQYAPCISTPFHAPQVAITLSDEVYAATLTFTNTNQEVTNPSYGIIWGPQGFNPATAGTTVSPINASTYTISNLTQTTTYDVYVYAISSNGNSDTVRYAFTTPFIPNCKTPNTLAASNVTYNTATITWNQPGDAPQFWTLRYADADFEPATAAASEYTELTITGSTPAAQLSGLVAGTTYYIYVKATCSTSPVDESPWSQMSMANPAFTFTTPECSTPTAVAASDVTNSTAKISWTENGTATAWTVKYGLMGFDPDMEGTAIAATADSLELTGLDAYTNYEVYVKSNCTATDESDWSNSITFRTACPDGGSATIGDGTSTTTGVPVANYGSTYCQQIFTADELREAGVASNIAGLAFNWSAIDASYDKYFTIWLANTDKSSFASTSDFVPYSDLTQVYGPVFIEHGTGAGEQEYVFNTPFTWDGNSNIVVVTLMNAGASDNNASRRAYTHNTGVSNISMYQRKDGSQYTEEQLATITGSSRSTYRANITFIAPCNTDVTCFAPASISATITPANVVTLTWAPRTDLRPVVNNYQVKYGLQGFNPETQGTLIDNLNNVTTYTINGGLEFEENYDVYVRTVCGAGDYSNWTKGTFVTYPSCWAPVDVTVTATTSNSATLTWANDSIAPAPSTRWEVAYGPEGFNPDNATLLETTNNTAFEVTGLNHSSKYEFYVRSKCSNDDHSPWSAVATGTTQCGVWQYADMPLVENFDGVTGTTTSTVAAHVLPNCWNYLNGGTSYAGYPIAYNSASYSYSGNNHMRFYEYTSSGYADQYAILPEFGFNLDTVVVGFYARESSSTATYVGKIVVGVMTNPEDAATFVAVDSVLPTTLNYEYFEVNFSEYAGNGRYIALKAPKPTTGYNVVYLDDLTVKLREKVNTLPNNGGAVVACNEFVMPDTVDGNYAGGLNATYVVRPAEAGKVAHITGSYDLEYGYDYLYVYRGEGANKVIVDTLTGAGEFDFVDTTSNDWTTNGVVTLVLKTDADNALNYTGFKFLVSCECPVYKYDMPVENIEALGSYTWTAGNGQTYEKHATVDNVPDLVETVDYTFYNVAGCDSVYRHLSLTVHPDYTLSYAATICERDTFDFYGQSYTTAGSYTVTLQSQYGADSTGVLALTVNSAPSAFIQYNNKTVTAVANMCDNFDMTLNARSNVEGATFLWEDSSDAALRVVNPHESNTYTVVAINAATGCTSLPATVTVTTTPVPALTISGDSAICVGQSATLTLADANNVPATYRWSTNATTESITVNPTTTTTYTVTATSTTGACVATAEFTVTVNALPVVEVAAAPAVICQNDMITLTATDVEGYSYSWSTGAATREATVAAAKTGNYTVTVTDQNGCVKEFTTNNVTVNPVYELNDEQSACVGMLPITWGAQPLTEAGSYDQTFQTVNGCDSTVHLTFTVQDTALNNANRELCEGATFTFGTGIYEQTYTATTSTVITYVDTTSGECPARYNLYLTVNTHNPATVENTVCDTYTWPLTNETYTTSGAYQTTLQTIKGCDSVVTLNLTVNYQNTGIDEQTACDQYEWIDGNIYTASNNTATYMLENEFGCDSVVTLNLTVNYRSYHEDFHRVCDATTYTWLDNEVYELDVPLADSIQYITGENSDGCLEIALLNLDLNYVSDTVRKTIDACDEYVIDTVSCDNSVATAYLRDNGIYTLRVHNDSLNRDEMLILTLTVSPSNYHTTIAEECLPYTWTILDANNEPFEIATITADMVNGASVYHTSVDMAEAGYVASSCSNIEVLRLTPKYPTEEVIEATICQNGTWTAPAPYTYVVNGSDLNVGLNTQIYNTGAGDLNNVNCPLIKKVELTVNPVYDETMELALCETEFDNNTLIYANPNDTNQTIELTIPGALNEVAYTNTVVANWQTALGCDSTVTIAYTVNPTTTETYTVASCYEYTWDINGETYKESGEYTNETTNEHGCLHTDILDLTINDTIRVTKDSVVCTRFEYEGTTYFTDQTFLEKVLPSEDACDTAIYIAFHVQQTELIHQYVVANRPYTWKNGQTFSQSIENVYYDEPSEGECGNVYSLHLTMVDPIVFCNDAFPYETSVNGITLTENDVVIDTASFCGNNDFSGVNVGPTSGGILNWGIKFDVNRPTDYYNVYGAQLYYDPTVNGAYEGNYTLNIYAGGDDAPATLIGTKTMNLSSADGAGWKYFQLDEPVNVDGQSLWVTFNTNSGASNWYGAASCVQYFDESDQNGAWVSVNGYPWQSMNDNNPDLYYSFMIKAIYSANMWKNDDPQGNDTILYYTVNKTYNNSEAVVACDSYTWDSVTYTASGDYTNNYTSAEGCDSVYTINLTVNVHTDSVLTVTACDSYTWAGNEFTATGDYVIDTNAAGEPLKNAAGCDSTATLHLTINVNNGVKDSIAACDSYTWHGSTYTANANETISFTDANGCTGDSVLILTIKNSVVANKDSIVNAASTYYLGVLYEAPIDTVINDTVIGAAANGCDSITKMRLQVNKGVMKVDTIAGFCGDYTWRDGNTYTWIPMAERTNPVFNYKNRTTGQNVNDYPIYETFDANGVVDSTYVLWLTMAEAYTEYKEVTVLLSNETYTDPADPSYVFDFAAYKAYESDTVVLDTRSYKDPVTGFYTDANNVIFCDSIVYYTFNLVYNYVDDDTVTVCYEDSTYTTANNAVVALAVGENNFTDTIAAGTDNEVVHNKVYVRSAAITGTETIAACDTVTWNNTLFSANVVDSAVVLTAANGCDSVVTLNITITPTIHNVVEPADICDSYTWSTGNGETYTADTVVLWSRANATDAQCTDVDTLKLVVNHSSSRDTNVTVCDTYTWERTGNTFTDNATDQYIAADANGCDDTINLVLTVNHSFNGAGNDIDTLGASITLTDSNGTYLFLAPYADDTTLVYKTVAGCDSIVTFHLTVNQFQIVAENPIECGVYTWNNAGHGTGHTYKWISDDEKSANAINIPGISPMLPLYKDITADYYVYNRPMDTVGDIVYMLNLNLNEAQFVDSTVARFPQSVNTMTLHGETFDFTGVTSATKPAVDTVVYLTLPHATLCGTVMTYNVHVVYNYTTDAQTVCYTDTYTWEDNTTSAVTVGSGNTITKTLFAGDWANEQVMTRTITVRANNNTYEFDQEACDSYTWNDGVYTTTGDYQQTFTDQNGCDSIATLHLTVKYNNNHGETIAACDSTQWNGMWVKATGDTTYAYTAENGCPSVDTLHLTINHNEPQVTTVSECDSYTWALNSREYTTSGNYTATRTDANGCQAADTLKLTIRKSTSYDSVMYVTDGSYRYTSADTTALILAGNVGTFAEHYTNAAQCDSTLNIEIHVGAGYFEAEDVVSCNSYTWRDGNTYVWISTDERTANNNALYKNQTTGAYVMSNPIYNVANEGDYDSIYMLRLNLTQNYTEDVTINFPISLGTLTYGDSTFNFTVTNDEGREFVDTTIVREVHFASSYYCDSIHYLTINLQNNYSAVAADNADICVTQSSYTWRGHELSTATDDYDHAHTYYMYDTVGTDEAPVVEYIKVTQHPVVYATERRTACDSYIWNGMVFTESTSNATFDTVDMWGCDSTVTLMLTIKHSSSHTLGTVDEPVQVCETYEWKANNAAQTVIDTYIQSGAYGYEYISDEGCPSVDSLYLTVNYNTNTAYTVDECDSYTWNNTEYTESGDYTFDYNTEAGCASTDTLHLTIRKNSNETIDKIVCDTYTWTAAEGGNGETYTESGVYTLDYTAENGCPSTNTLNLTVNKNSGHIDEVVACDSIDWHGTMYYADITGVTFSYTDANNCASIDTLALTVNHATHNAETVVACQTYTWHGTVIDNPSSVGDMFYHDYTYNYSNEDGCASTDTLHLTLGGGRTFSTEEVTWCGPYTWVVNGEEVGPFTESVETTTSFVNPRTGCDSVIFLNLTILDAPTANESATICASQLPYTWRGKTFEAAGEDSVHVASDAANGCDSIIYFTLTVNPIYAIELTADVCLGSGYTGYDFDIAADDIANIGEYTFVNNFATENGCDSIVTLTVNVKSVFATTVEATACDSYTWTDGNGQTYTESGNYDYTIAADNSCDSVVTLALTINSSTTGIDEQVACNRFTWIDGNTYTASNNTATFTLENAAGCDSVVTLNLTVNYSNNYEFEDVACDSYTWNGATYNQSGNYTYAGTNVDGCDSVVTLHLTINNSTTGAVSDVACDTYTWETGNGETYTESGNYTYTTTAANGCDSVVTLALTINTSNTGIDEQTACETFTWINGETYTASNNEATFKLTNAAGCDSVVTLNLTINTATTGIDEQTACETYTWINGETHTASNNEASYTLTNAAGCDSVVTLNLTILNATTGVDVQSACDSYTWIDGVTYTASNNEATYTLTAANGCDSVVTLDLTINASTTGSETVAACNTYDWHGQTYNLSGIYTFDTLNAAGCDSTVTLNLVISQNVSTTEIATACDSYEWNGQTYTESGVYTFNGTANGCDSVVTLLLTIKNGTHNAEAVTNCVSYTWHNTEYDQSGDYTYSYTNADGCASVDTLHLTINQPVTGSVSATACSSYTWTDGNGETYTTNGTYTYTTTAANGCDSIVTLSLTVYQPMNTTDVQTACGSYVWNGQNYTTSGTYTEPITDLHGCSATATLHLTILQPANSTESITACDSYTWNGQSYTTSGTYTSDFVDANGCDATATLNLTINQSTASSTTWSACDSYEWNGQTYATSGVYTYTTAAANGCDSVATLNLTINQSSASSFTETACSSYTWTDGTGISYTTSGSYTYTTSDVNGCDSVVTLILMVNQPVNATVYETACDGYTWTNGSGLVYTTSGEYIYTTNAANGCDSLVTLALTINNSVENSINVTACNNYRWNDVIYDATGEYTQVMTARNGCDSTVTLNLTIATSVTVTETITSCDSYEWNGTLYTVSGTYTWNGNTVIGCDSVMTLNLTINYSADTTLYMQGEGSIVWNDETFTESGVYERILQTVNGCDSVVTLNLAILPEGVPTPYLYNVMDVVLMINHNDEGMEDVHYIYYRWYRNGELVLEGPDKDSYSEEGRKLNGCYYLEVATDETLEYWVRSNEVCITSEGIDDVAEFDFTIAPNPVLRGSIVKVSVEAGAADLQNAEIRIFDVQGRQVLQQKNNGTIVADLPTGMYMVRLSLSDGRTAVRRLIVK